MKKFVTVGLGVTLLISLAAVVVVTAAPGAEGTLNTYFVPSTYTASLGETFSMDLWTDATSELRVQGMSANITFDPDFLEVTTFTDGCLGTHFDGFDNVAGTININASILGPNLQESPCAVKNIEFTVKADAPGGATTIAFTDACIAAGPGPDCYTTVTEDGTVVVPVEQTLTVIVDPAGSGTVDQTPAPPYMTMDVVTLDPGTDVHHWSFTGWTGDPLEGSMDDPATITMTQDYTVTAHFASATTHTVTVGDATGGTVDVVEQWDDLLDVYEDGEIITVTATAGYCYEFAGWTGTQTGMDNPLVITLSADEDFAPTFTQPDYDLTVNIVDPDPGITGTVTLDPAGGTYACGTVVTLTATWDGVGMFKDWSGDLMGSDNPDTITVDENKVVTATFLGTIPWTFDPNPDGGTVSTDPTQPPDGFVPGTVVTLTATPDTCYEFVGWIGLDETEPEVVITATEPLSFTAEFAMITHATVVTNVVGQGSMAVMPASGPYMCGDTITVTATAADVWTFDQWSGTVTFTDAFTETTQAVIGEAAPEVTAHFMQYKLYLPLVTRNHTPTF